MKKNLQEEATRELWEFIANVRRVEARLKTGEKPFENPDKELLALSFRICKRHLKYLDKLNKQNDRQTYNAPIYRNRSKKEKKNIY